MGTDYAEKEREFVAALGEDTGSSLEGWMTAIAATGLSDRNAIIDWLRHQGFAFSRASWLERIHHNGGRLIYADGGHATHVERSAEPPRRGAPEPPPASAAPVSAPPPSQPSAEIIAVLAAAKGLRPLADFVLREIAVAVPGVHFEAREPLVLAAAGRPFVALLPQPKMLRLYGDFGANAALGVRAAEAMQKSPSPFPQMILLDDARRVDQAFRDLVAAAASRANA